MSLTSEDNTRGTAMDGKRGEHHQEQMEKHRQWMREMAMVTSPQAAAPDYEEVMRQFLSGIQRTRLIDASPNVVTLKTSRVSRRLPFAAGHKATVLAFPGVALLH